MLGLLVSMGPTGCTFDNRGVPVGDGGFSGVDGVDGSGIDASSGLPCEGKVATNAACKYLVDGSVGLAGSCADDGGFLLVRHCFPQAPCNKATGYCEPRNSTSKCSDPSDCVQGLCTYLYGVVNDEAVVEAHCVTATVDGGSATGAPCGKHSDCKTGLCADKNFCLGYCGDAGVSTTFDYIDDPATVTTACPPFDGGVDATADATDIGAIDAGATDAADAEVGDGVDDAAESDVDPPVADMQPETTDFPAGQ